MPESVLAFLTTDWLIRLLFGLAALVAVVGLLRLTARRRAHGSPAGRHGNERRLAVLDQVPIDERQRLVLIRRDDVEHLLILGGASPVVVETRIGYPAVEAPARTEAAPARAAQPAADAARVVPAAAPSLDSVARERVTPLSVERPRPEPARRESAQPVPTPAAPSRAERPAAAAAPVTTPPVATPSIAPAAPEPPARGVGRLFAGLAGRGAATAGAAAGAATLASEPQARPATAPEIRAEPLDAFASRPNAGTSPARPAAPEIRVTEAPRESQRPAPDVTLAEADAGGEPLIAVKVDSQFADMAGPIEDALRRPLPPAVETPAQTEEAFARDLERAIGTAVGAPAGGHPAANEPAIPDLEAEMADLLGRPPAR